MLRSGHDEIEIYLGDHWAGAGAGSALARRLRDSNIDTAWGEALTWLAEQIDRDQDALAEIRRAHGTRTGLVKRAFALAGERIGLLKLNGQLTGYSDLSRVLEIEALASGVAAKRRLWIALGHDERATACDVTELQQRAEEQLALLEEFHVQATAVAFAAGTLTGPRSPMARN